MADGTTDRRDQKARKPILFEPASDEAPEADSYPKLEAVCERVADMDLDELCALTPEELLEQRYRRYRRIGVYEENGSSVRFTEH